MFVGKALEQRSSYRVLGVLLFLQLGLSACASAATLLMRSFARSSEQTVASLAVGSRVQQAAEYSRQRRGQRILLIDVRHPLTVHSLLLRGSYDSVAFPVAKGHKCKCCTRRRTLKRWQKSAGRKQTQIPAMSQPSGVAPSVLGFVRTPRQRRADMCSAGSALQSGAAAAAQRMQSVRSAGRPLHCSS